MTRLRTRSVDDALVTAFFGALGLAAALGAGCLEPVDPAAGDDAEGADVAEASEDIGESYFCDSPDPSWEEDGSERGTISLQMEAITPPHPVATGVWDVVVVGGDARVTQRVVAHPIGDRLLAADWPFPCEAGRTYTFTVTPVALYQDATALVGEYGDPAPEDGTAEALLDTPLTVMATCPAAGEQVVALFGVPAQGVGIGDPGPHGIFDAAAVYSRLACHAEIDCCQDTDYDGQCDGTRAWWPPSDGVDASVVTWSFYCFDLYGALHPDSEEAQPPYQLFLDDLVLDCGEAGRVVVDPTALTDGAAYCATPGDAAAPPSGCVGLEGAETGLLRQVEVDTYGSDQPEPFAPTARLDVRLGVDLSTLEDHNCRLIGRAVGLMDPDVSSLVGLGAPDDASAYGVSPAASLPAFVWKVPLTEPGRLLCGDHEAVTLPTVYVTGADASGGGFARRLAL